ncbi:hypothetical protein PPTG_14520 [Plasmopara halstedii]|uniref:Choline transporter-like protein n=1 Tax=Plasmopara halstedii TaxID=4781 RepID=A0A0P1B1D6_PLAHL|nr:hypothetical protein PPTG_14520 [Plasmopara halstedii]CEG48550.1 hypothetical protein PPTG_14520 [Plasmopara halstedii]|eukprot:XP_024584919.1 hypothetical protein PPTG_14520 [Plasmopara halstedii]
MFNHSYTSDASRNYSAPEVNPIKPEKNNPEDKAGCQDWPYAVLFVLNVGVIIALMALWGVKTVTDSQGSSSELLSGDDTRVVVSIAVGMAVISMTLALTMVKLIVAYARVMILFVLWFNVGISCAFAAYGFIIGNLFIAIFGVLIALLHICYARAVQHRIPFAVANLRVAEGAISKHGSTYIVSVVFTVVQIVWVVIWSMALVGVANEIAENEPDNYASNTSSTRSTSRQPRGSYAAFFFLLLSFYWGLQVFKNVAHTTVAGTVATFWYQAESKGATAASLKRATTTSFGSICFGSLIVAFLQALRALAENGRQEGSAMACFAECILGCLQSLMEYFNRWAYVYVGIYGYKFTQAGKAVFELFKQRGFDAIINDDLIGNVLGFAALGVGLICAGAGALIAETTDAMSFHDSTVFLAVLGLVVGIGVAVTPLAVIDSSVATIFVCFAEDPAAFQRSHPDLYAPLVQEWHNLYPEVMVQAGYCLLFFVSTNTATSMSSFFIDEATTNVLARQITQFSHEGTNGTNLDTEKISSERLDMTTVIHFVAIVLLIIMSAIASGLTLGLLSLDKVSLDVIVRAGGRPGATLDEMKKARAAKRILPVRADSNLLLTTLVLTTVAVNSLLSILMADLTNGLVGFFVSTILIVLCGEIIPQSLCSRHALIIGSTFVPFVRVLRLVLYIFAKPVSYVLDRTVGEDVGTVFTKRELQKLVEIHVNQKIMHPEEGFIVRGAMRYKNKVVSDIMIPARKVFSLPISFTMLNFSCL